MRSAALAGFLAIGLGCMLAPNSASAQWSSPYAGNITVKQYIREAGGVARYVAPGRLKLGGKRVMCGRRPSIIDPEFDTWAGAYTNPGFIIINPRYMRKETRAVQLYIYAHECGHQFRGFDEDTADAFAIRRGVRQGWLKRRGMGQICRFISKIPGDAEHPAGPLRCKRMTKVYRAIVVKHNQSIARKKKARKSRRVKKKSRRSTRRSVGRVIQ